MLIHRSLWSLWGIKVTLRIPPKLPPFKWSGVFFLLAKCRSTRKKHMPSTCTPIVFPGTLCRSDLMANFVAQILGLERLYRHLMRNHRIPLEKSTNTPLKFNVAGENQTPGKGDSYNWKPPFLETMLDLGSVSLKRPPLGQRKSPLGSEKMESRFSSPLWDSLLLFVSQHTPGALRGHQRELKSREYPKSKFDQPWIFRGYFSL